MPSCGACKTAQTLGIRLICDGCKLLLETNQQKYCSGCTSILSLSCFGKDSSKPQGVNATCKLCTCARKIAHNKTVSGKLQTLWNNSKLHGAALEKKGAGTHGLKREDMDLMWSRQCGKCIIAGIPLVTTTGHSWLASLERVDMTKNYSLKNCVLIALEFNTRVQWTKAKLLSIEEAVLQNLPVQTAEALVKFEQGLKQPRLARKSNEYSNGQLQCRKCNQFKPCSEFMWRTSEKKFLANQGCTNCRKNRSKDPYIALRVCWNAATLRTRQNVEKHKWPKETTCVSFEDVINLFIFQKGRCSISNIPFQWTGGHWRMSLERIDTKRGYEPGNVTLICAEFNCCERESKCGMKIGWTKEKLQFALNHVVLL